jgi:MFS family permease
VGISVVWPLLLADVNNEARHPALAIGGVTACGYLGMVAGPALVAAITALFDLQVALLVLAGIALFVAVVPAHVRTPENTPT